jgi:Pyridoxamine 5'-phosphate oxidase
MNVDEAFGFMRGESLGVLCSVNGEGQPQAALVGFAVTPELEIVFDTVKSSRKYANLKKDARCAWVIGCTSEVTVQYEGLAKELDGEELARYKKVYFGKFEDGPVRESWAGITYFVVRPKWVRYCDYNLGQQRIEEKDFSS